MRRGRGLAASRAKMAAATAAGSRNKRPLEEFEDGGQPDLERHYSMKCSCSPSQTPPLSCGFASSPVIVLDTGGSFDEDLDDTILDPSDEENPDSPTGLSREAEDELIANDLEDSPDSVAAELNYNGEAVLVSPESVWPLRAPDETDSMKPLQQNGPATSSSEGAVCGNYLEHLGSGKPSNKGSQIHAESSSGCSRLKFPEAASDTAASLNLEKEGGLPEITDRKALQTETSQLAARHEPSRVVGQACLGHTELRGENASNSLAGKSSDAVGLHGKVATSTRVNGIIRPSSPINPQRICIQEADLESTKERYINAVLNHASSVPPVIDSVQEMYCLVDSVASQSRYEHPTDLTVRNYAQRSQSTTRKCNLSQWVDRSLRHFGRFAGIPDYFERSPTFEVSL